jgi:hypothetical protein
MFCGTERVVWLTNGWDGTGLPDCLLALVYGGTTAIGWRSRCDECFSPLISSEFGCNYYFMCNKTVLSTSSKLVDHQQGRVWLSTFTACNKTVCDDDC